MCAEQPVTRLFKKQVRLSTWAAKWPWVNLVRGLGEQCKLPSGTLGKAPAPNASGRSHLVAMFFSYSYVTFPVSSWRRVWWNPSSNPWLWLSEINLLWCTWTWSVCWHLSCFTLPAVKVNTQPSLCHSILNLWHTALYKCVFIGWLIDWFID